MEEGKVETRIFAHKGKIRIQVVDCDDAIEMEGGVYVAKHMIESLEKAIKEVEETM